MKEIKEIIDNVELLRNDILNYIISTENCLFNWISNKEVQDFIKAYPEDYEYMFNLSVSNIGISPLIKISFDEHPNDISYIERNTVLTTFRDTTKARWMEWNGKVKELQISEKEKELNYYKNMVDKTEKEIEELKSK
jgi:hypothetical protein